MILTSRLFSTLNIPSIRRQLVRFISINENSSIQIQEVHKSNVVENDKVERNSEKENKDKINNRYSLRSFPRRERLPNYNAELKPFSESTSEIECYSHIQIESLIQYVLYVTGEIDLNQLDIYVSYFHMVLSPSLKDSIEKYSGLKKYKYEDSFSTTCLFIPSNLRNNMLYLLLSDMPLLKEYCKKDQTRLLSVNEVKTTLHQLYKDEEHQVQNIQSILQYIQSKQSAFIQSQSINNIIEDLLGTSYTEKLRQIMERQWNKLQSLSHVCIRNDD